MPASAKFQQRWPLDDLEALGRLTERWTPPGRLPNRTATLRRAVRECLSREEKRRERAPEK